MKKYGRTYHLPTSQGVSSDDKIISSLRALQNAAQVVFTEKMDGENTTIHATGCHARSPDSGYHPSRDWMKAFAAGISPALEPGERIVGEYLFARHSISYTGLPSYFLGFGWFIEDTLQAWDDTLTRFETLGITPVPTLHRGTFTDHSVQTVLGKMDFEHQEGFVVRSCDGFHESQMHVNLAKYVRAGHVQSEVHWSKQAIVKNGLA